MRCSVPSAVSSDSATCRAVDFPNDPNKPPGYYSNSYGGIDTYVQQITPGGNHDAFYTDSNIQAAYQVRKAPCRVDSLPPESSIFTDTTGVTPQQKWLSCAIPMYKNHPAVFSWELANDPRCQGAVGTTTSSSCTTTTITQWVKTNSAYIKSLDPFHMVGAGDGGFKCTQSTCKKINPLTGTTNPAAPQTSISPGDVANGKKRKRRWLTSADVLKRARDSEKAARGVVGDAVKKIRIRGGWAAPATVKSTRSMSKRQDTGSVGSAYDGSYGVDSEDICQDPDIDFCSLQIFPDQVFYGATSITESRKRAASDSSAGTTPETIADAINFILNTASDKS